MNNFFVSLSSVLPSTLRTLLILLLINSQQKSNCKYAEINMRSTEIKTQSFS